MTTHDGHFDVLWPRSPRQMKDRTFAPRFASLEGRTVAQLWDYLFRGDEVFDALEEGLRARYPGIRFVSWREFGNIHADNERAVLAALPARLKALGVDAAIVSMAA